MNSLSIKPVLLAPNVDDSIVQFRLDMLRLTFSIETILERHIEAVFSNRIEINVNDFDQYFEKGAYIILKLYVSKRNYLKDIFTTKNNDDEYFKIKNFINQGTFGDNIRLFELLSATIVNDIFYNLINGVGKSTLAKWYEVIKDIRNTMAHRSKIEISTFFQKMSTPKMPSNKSTFLKLSDIEKRKYVIKHLLQNEATKQINIDIFVKYGI